MPETITFEAPESGKRRRFTLQQKRALLLAAEAPGASISIVGRQHGIHPNLLFQWRRAMENGEEKGLESGENVVPASQLKQAEAAAAAKKNNPEKAPSSLVPPIAKLYAREVTPSNHVVSPFCTCPSPE